MRSSKTALAILIATTVISSLVVEKSLQQQQQPSARIRASPLASRLRSTTSQQTANQAAPGSRPTGSNIRERLVGSNSSTNSISNNANGKFEFTEDELPPDFYEMPPEQLDLGMNATGIAPVPVLNVAVLQNGQVIDSAINVNPGTPLEMVIYLDDKSAKVYGLLASYLKVQDDTFRQREEVIISNGCSLDTYIFGNFELNAEDQSLRAKFRAFKFPDSNFVRFVGTVNVCIKQCPKVNCGGSRRKRATENNSQHKLVQLTVSTVLRISNNPKK